MPAIAEAVTRAIGKGAASDYLLHAWVVMPNHVHLLITPRLNVSSLRHRLKGASARESNRLLGRTGQPFWQDESYDRLVRSADEIQRIEKLYSPKPGASRAGSNGRGISMVEYLQSGGLKPAAG